MMEYLQVADGQKILCSDLELEPLSERCFSSGRVEEAEITFGGVRGRIVNEQ